MRIQHNITAKNSYRNYSKNAKKLSKNLEKLSSGYKINRAGDDAAGLAISEKMRSQITGLKAAQKNVKDGISLVKTAEGALQEIHDMLNRMTYLATQSANGTYDSTVDRPNLNKELNALRTEVNRIANSSNFNGRKLLNGDLTAVESNKDPTKVTVINPNATATVLHGSNMHSSIIISLTGMALEQAGTVDFTIFGQTYSINVSDSEKADSSVIAGHLRQAIIDGNKFTDPSAGDFSVRSTNVSGSTIILDSANEKDVSSDVFKTGPITVTPGKVAVPVPVDDTAGRLILQIGDTNEIYNQIDIHIESMSAEGLGIDRLNISTKGGAKTAIDAIKAAIDTVSQARGQLGAYQNRLEHANSNLAVMEENIQDAESTIRDTDVADEMTAYTKNNILLQSAQAMLAQANQMPQGVLQLLG